MCFEHGENFNSYCKTCEKNLCLACEMEHSNHNIIFLGKLIPNKKDCDKRMNELNEKINKLKEDIKKLINILNSFMSNIEIYYNTINDINLIFIILWQRKKKKLLLIFLIISLRKKNFFCLIF